MLVVTVTPPANVPAGSCTMSPSTAAPSAADNVGKQVVPTWMQACPPAQSVRLENPSTVAMPDDRNAGPARSDESVHGDTTNHVRRDLPPRAGSSLPRNNALGAEHGCPPTQSGARPSSGPVRATAVVTAGYRVRLFVIGEVYMVVSFQRDVSGPPV